MLAVGCLTAAPAAASEYIRIVKDGEVWWFEEGGKRFFSLGVACVGGCYGHYEKKPIKPKRKEGIVSSLEKWGFNTAACWSSPSVWNDMYFADQIYSGFDYKINDVFDEKLWEGWLESQIRAEMQAFLGNKNLIGYFLDNEVPWRASEVLELYLGLKRKTPGSKELIRFLKKYYKSGIAVLNGEWGTEYRNFKKIPGSEPPKETTAALDRMSAAWRNHVAAAYYKRYSRVVRDEDPDHLILGIRYSGTPDMELFKAVSPYFDVDSINDYTRYGNLSSRYAEYYAATGKPLMITEWSFSGFPEPGRKSLQFIDVYNQERRAHGYRKYVLAAARAPFMVGMHWFLWTDYWPQDEAKGGYLPDENMGLVTWDESRVYDELVAECTRTNGEVDAVHRAAKWEKPAPEKKIRKDISKYTPVIDGDISEWPDSSAVTPHLSESLLPDVKFAHTYYISWGAGTIYIAGDISDSRIDFPGKDWCWEGDYLSIIVSSTNRDEFGNSESVFVHIIPTGHGDDANEPYGYSWGAFKDDSVIEVVRRDRPGGYVIEASIPTETISEFGSTPDTVWQVDLNYRNINEIYETRWGGEIVIKE